MCSRRESACVTAWTAIVLGVAFLPAVIAQVPYLQRSPTTTDGHSFATSPDTNPNATRFTEYGWIEWHGDTATLFAGNVRPLDLTPHTLSSCLGIPVNFEDPRDRYADDLFDITDPQLAARRPGLRMYIPPPTTVEIKFPIDSSGMPMDVLQLLEDATTQVNQQRAYGYRVNENSRDGQTSYTLTPTTSRNEKGELEQIPAYLDQKISIAPTTAPIYEIASRMTDALGKATGQNFGCCQTIILGHLWGERSITYQATDLPARTVLESLMQSAVPGLAYSLRCQPLNPLGCFISVSGVSARRKPATAPKSGVCAAIGTSRN